ncbi:MAG: MMPL family transporter, partial [Actinomycetota bacterium]
VAEGVEISTPLSIAAVTVLLVLAVRSRRAAAAILLALVAGLALTAAFAAAAVGTLNPISVAFAVLFVGIAVDFGIQFTIRLRDEQTRAPDRAAAVAATASAMAGPLSLAALATAVGFLSFLPTAYAGVAQLGLIAGVGMLIALVVCLTLLPALLGLLRPPPARDVVGLRLARPLERWLHRHARAVVVAALAAAAIGAGLSPWLHFDFNPLNLQNPRSESVRAFRDLASQPETSPYAIDALAPSLDAADEMGRRFDRLPEVDHTITLTDLIPEQQDAKLAVLADLQMLLGPTLAAGTPPPPPTAAELAGRLADTAGRLRGASPAATELADRLGVVAASGPQAVERFAAAVTAGLPALLDDLRHMLDARPVTRASLPPELARRWIAADGRARIEVVPKGDMQDEKALTRFVAAVEAVDPEVSGAPVSIVAAGRTVITAFAEAGLIALTAITGLLLAVLRRPGDVALVLLPLALGALYTVVGAVAGGLAINFANIICLPLLLGIGVAFSIYFVLNRRRGLRRPLSAATGRAVLYSALTTGSAFGSLGLSPHRGTASMGLLLFLALGLAVATVFLVLPAVFAVIERRGRGSSAPGR